MEREKFNPLIKPDQLSPSHDGFRVKGAFNPGAAIFNNEIILLMRVAEDCTPHEGYTAVPYYRFENGKFYADILKKKINDPLLSLKDSRGVAYDGKDYLSTMSHIRIARSTDGINFTVDSSPFIYPTLDCETYGVEDCRVTKIGDEYYLIYTAVSTDGWATMLAVTKDFKTIEKKGLIFPPPNKDVSIFPEKINNKYCALHRPHNEGFGKPSIWYAESDDLLHCGDNKCLLRPRDNGWENKKIGGGSAPIKTDAGWLEIYHGKGG